MYKDAFLYEELTVYDEIVFAKAIQFGVTYLRLGSAIFGERI